MVVSPRRQRGGVLRSFLVLLGVLAATGVQRGLAGTENGEANGANGKKGVENIGVYFGSGCFWHVQHEIIEAEKRILNRQGRDLTALVGYAGGDDPEVHGGKRACYHGDPDDYDKYGHTEVVHVFVPPDKISAMAKEFWALFVGINRVDVQDVGKEYRAALGLPGGYESPYLAEVEAAQEGVTVQPFELRKGLGGDADTLGKALVWVYDTNTFPFFQGEVYHQFHDDMVEKYDAPYHALKDDLLAAGTLKQTGCARDGGRNLVQPRIKGGKTIWNEVSDPGEETDASRATLRAWGSGGVPLFIGALPSLFLR